MPYNIAANQILPAPVEAFQKGRALAFAERQAEQDFALNEQKRQMNALALEEAKKPQRPDPQRVAAMLGFAKDAATKSLSIYQQTLDETGDEEAARAAAQKQSDSDVAFAIQAYGPELGQQLNPDHVWTPEEAQAAIAQVDDVLGKAKVQAPTVFRDASGKPVGTAVEGTPKYQRLIDQGLFPGKPVGTASEETDSAPSSVTSFNSMLEAANASPEERQRAARIELGLEPKAGAEADPQSVEQVAQMIAEGRMAPLTSISLRSPWGQAVMARVAEINPDYQGGTYNAKTATLRAFSSGVEGRTVRSLNVAIAHLGTLSDLSDALSNGDVQALNRARNSWQKQTGEAAPTNFEAARDIVANEVVKAVTNAGGALADRQEAQNNILAAKSPEQLAGAIKTFKQLLGGQLEGLRQQYEQGTGQDDFDRFLSPETRRELEPAGGDLSQISDDELRKQLGL